MTFFFTSSASLNNFIHLCGKTVWTDLRLQYCFVSHGALCKDIQVTKERKQSHLIFPPRGKTHNDSKDQRVDTCISEMIFYYFLWVGGHRPSFSVVDVRQWCKGIIDHDVKANLQMSGKHIQQQFITAFIYSPNVDRGWRLKSTVKGTIFLNCHNIENEIFNIMIKKSLKTLLLFLHKRPGCIQELWWVQGQF